MDYEVNLGFDTLTIKQGTYFYQCPFCGTFCKGGYNNHHNACWRRNKDKDFNSSPLVVMWGPLLRTEIKDKIVAALTARKEKTHAINLWHLKQALRWENKKKARRQYEKKHNWPVIRKQTIALYGGACPVTGDEKNLHVHHIDGDYTNNAIGNLIPLAKSIHFSIERDIFSAKTVAFLVVLEKIHPGAGMRIQHPDLSRKGRPAFYTEVK